MTIDERWRKLVEHRRYCNHPLSLTSNHEAQALCDYIDHLTAELAAKDAEIERLSNWRDEYSYFRQSVAKAWGSIGESMVADFTASAKEKMKTAIAAAIEEQEKNQHNTRLM